jgi:hypothetical protein
MERRTSRAPLRDPLRLHHITYVDARQSDKDMNDTTDTLVLVSRGSSAREGLQAAEATRTQSRMTQPRGLMSTVFF